VDLVGQDKIGYRIAVAGVAAGLVVFLVMAAVVVVTGGTVPTEYWSAGSAVGGGLLGILAPTPPSNGLSAAQRSANGAHASSCQGTSKAGRGGGR
jgi:hypothetical protein